MKTLFRDAQPILNPRSGLNLKRTQHENSVRRARIVQENRGEKLPISKCFRRKCSRAQNCHS